MPLFIFISGWLFCLTCLNRDVSYRGMMAKKLSRLGIPFLFFTVVALLAKLALSSFVKRPVDLREIINTFLLFSSNPLEEMWFITVLIILMSIYPVYRWLLRYDGLIWGLGAALVIFFVLPADIKLFRLSAVARMAPYFIAGIICCRYGVIEKYASKWWVAMSALVLFVGVNVFEIADPYLTEKTIMVLDSTFGIILSICICMFITGLRPATFSSFSAYTFQIFLLGIFFQMGIRMLYGKIGHHSGFIYPLLFVVSIIVGVFIPVMIAKVLQKHFPRLKKLFGL